MHHQARFILLMIVGMVLAAWVGCQQPVVSGVSPEASSSNAPSPVPLPETRVGDGIYLVPDDRSAGVKKVNVLFADRKESSKLSLPLTPDVPLDLAVPPEFSVLEDGRQTVQLRFAEESARELEELTKKYKDSNRHIAVVIGGEVISQHKFRSTISDGQVQISCCDPNACDRLKLALP